MIMSDVKEFIKENSEPKYAEFIKRLVPDTSYEILGVRLPKLKAFAKTVAKDKDFVIRYLSAPHDNFEEWFLHGFLISYAKFNFETTMLYFEKFVPHIDCWSICDSGLAIMKIFGKNREKLLPYIKKWLSSNNVYTVRVGIITLLDYYVEEKYFDTILELTKPIENHSYYVDMALAWLYSVILVKGYDYIIKFIENREFSIFIHNKTIQKAVESFRITNERKTYLKSLKIKDKK